MTSMTMIDNLTHELEGKFGVGQAAKPLMRELLELMTARPGGLGGFLDRFRSAGLGKEVSSFVGGKSATPLTPKTVDAALGESTVAGIAQRVGLKPSVASTALGFEIPKMIGLLTQGGKVPTALPTEFQSFLKPAEQVGPLAMATIREDEQVGPLAMTTVRMAKPQATKIEESRGGYLWILPLLGLLALAALLWWVFLPKKDLVAPLPRMTAVTVPSVPAVPRIAAIATLNRTLTATVLNFATASATLPPASAPALQQAAQQIKSMPAGTVIEIAGHTDNVGDPGANLSLSQRRAEAVRDALVQDGVAPSMLTAKGYGETQPVATNDTSEGRLHNRRIEFTTTGVTIRN